MDLPTSFFNHDAQAGGFYPKSHVGIDVTRLAQRQNTLIEGIRGSGKTHVLKMIQRQCLETFEERRVLPIYVSLAQISEHARKDPAEFRLRLYAYIVQRCVETADIYRTMFQRDKTLMERAMQYILRLFKISSAPSPEALLLTIRQTAELLLFKLQFDLTSSSFRELAEATSTRQAEFGVAAKAGVPPVGVSTKAVDTRASTISAEAEATMMYMGSRLVHHDAAAFVVEFLRQMQIVLDLQYTLLLIDECSEASPPSQAEVFRLFKTIRGALPSHPDREACAFFVGTVYPRGETYYPTRESDGFSFEPGQDCTMEFLQWDETDLSTYNSFFEGMLLNRAREVISFPGDLAALQNQLFDTNEAFQLASFAAHGIPRRFWELAKRAYDHSSGKITRNLLQIAIQDIANDHILGDKTITQKDTEFVNSLVSTLAKRNDDIRNKNRSRQQNLIPQNIYFAVERRDAELLRRLIMQGAIHDKSRTRTIRKPARPEAVFALDMAVAYAFRVIPPKGFSAVVARDLPRCLPNDFDQAPTITPDAISSIYGTPKRRPSTAHPPSPQKEPPTVLTGILVSYSRGKGGWINADRPGAHLPFSADTLEPRLARSLSPGDRVEFLTRSNKRGRLVALRVRRLRTRRQVQGIVKSMKAGQFGVLEVLDAGPDAFFLAKELRSTPTREARLGDKVVFDLVDTPRGREAINIRFYTSTTAQLTPNLNEVARYVVELARSAPAPTPLATVAFAIRNHFGDVALNTQWFGFGSLKDLLFDLDLQTLDLLATGPGYLYDPDVHGLPSQLEDLVQPTVAEPEPLLGPKEPPPAPGFSARHRDIALLAMRIHNGTGTPFLPPEVYALIFQETAVHINAHGYQMSDTARAVRDKCVEAGSSVARAHMNFILRGIFFSGHRFAASIEYPHVLATAFVTNTVALCKRAGIPLTEEEQSVLRRWLAPSPQSS